MDELDSTSEGHTVPSDLLKEIIVLVSKVPKVSGTIAKTSIGDSEPAVVKARYEAGSDVGEAATGSDTEMSLDDESVNSV